MVSLIIDVEGNEAAVLRGSKIMIGKDSTREVCCTYHNATDQQSTELFFSIQGVSDRIFPRLSVIATRKTSKVSLFRKGQIRAWKESTMVREAPAKINLGNRLG